MALGHGFFIELNIISKNILILEINNFFLEKYGAHALI